MTRRWVPWRRRVKGAGKAFDSIPYMPTGDDPISSTVGIILLIVFSPLIIAGLLLLGLALLEVLLLLALIPVLAGIRIAFGTSWIVEVRRGFTPYYEQPAGRWRQSGEAIRQIAAAIERGQVPPHTLQRPPRGRKKRDQQTDPVR